MKTKFQYLLLCCVSAILLPIYADDNIYTDPRIQITVPSTEAQSLGTFAEIPVDLHTGRTNINIPLLTISYRDIELPISISYHGGGIKVDEEAGVVGLGWTLNAGGVVSRIVRGMPDELSCHNGMALGYDRINQETRDFVNSLKQRELDEDPMNLLEEGNRNALSQMVRYGYLYDENKIDVAPDNYVFYTQNVSGAFVGRKPQNVQSNVGCSFKYQNEKYYLTDIKGYLYEFAQLEHRRFPSCVGDVYLRDEWNSLLVDWYKYVSAWWLSTIYSPAGDSINFTYIEEKRLPPRSNLFTYTQHIGLDELNNPIVKHSTYNSVEGSFAPVGYDTVYHQLLSDIITQNSWVKFHYSLPTSSLPNARQKLDSISLYAQSSDGWDLIERFTFRYSDGSSTRKLRSMVHKGRTGETQKYEFSYFYSNDSGDINSRDHWGYFSSQSKGRFANKNYLGIKPIGLGSSLYTERYADNRNAHNHMLRSITYPSGLEVDFTWEPHQFSELSHLAQTSPLEYNYSKQPPVCDTIIRDQFTLWGKENRDTLFATRYLTTNQYIDLDLLHFFYSSEVWTCMHCVMNWRQEYPASELPRFSIKLDGREIFSRILDSVHVQPRQVQNEVNDLVFKNGPGYYTFALEHPRSTLRSPSSGGAYCDLYHEMFNKPETALGTIPITIYETNCRENPSNECGVGGVRIKRIKYSQGAKTLMLKEYAYIDSVGNSTGVLAYSPRYASKNYVISRTEMSDSDISDDLNISTSELKSELLVLRSNGLPYTLNGGGHIEYKQVTEYMVSHEGIYSGEYQPINRIDYYYTTAASPSNSDIDDTNYEAFIPADMLQLTSQKHKRGNLWKKVEYTDEQRTTIYTHRILEKPDIELSTGVLFPIADYQNVTYGLNGYRPYKNFGIVKYRVIPYNKQLLSQTTIGEKTKTYHTYQYNTNTYSELRNADLPIIHTFVNAQGDTIIEQFEYWNYTDKIKKYIATKHGYVIDAYQLTYDSIGRIKQKEVALLTPTSPVTDEQINWDIVEIYKYDSIINKVVEVIDCRKKITTTYLWSYGGEYPIAEITNATLTEVKNKISVDIELLQNSYTPNMSSVNNLRAVLPNASIKTMTYEPLIGMSSFTDPKGYTQYYEYDDFGRVKNIYEIVGDTRHILKHFEYQVTNH